MWSPSLKSLLLAVIFCYLYKICESGKMPFGNVGSELGDYRLKNGEPFVTLFEHENYRGKIHRQRIHKDCSNIPRPFQNWASSIQHQMRCVTLCDARDCGGNCKNIYPNEKGVKRLAQIELNDKAASLKFCYSVYQHYL